MRLNNPDKEESFVEDNYDKSIEELTWHLIKEQLVKANDIKVEQEDITNMAKEATRAQFALIRHDERARRNSGELFKGNA